MVIFKLKKKKNHKHRRPKYIDINKIIIYNKLCLGKKKVLNILLVTKMLQK